MKKILIIALIALFSQSIVYAQKPQKVNEKDVPVRYVKDFQRNVKDAKSVEWTVVDSVIYDAAYTTEDNDNKTVYRFSKKGMEIHYYIDSKWYPHAITDTVKNQYPKHKITDVYVRNVRNKSTYQARIAKRKGFFKKKDKEVKFLNFETNGKFIDAVEVK